MNKNTVLFLRTLLFLLYLAVIFVLAIVLANPATLWALLLVFWVQQAISELLPMPKDTTVADA